MHVALSAVHVIGQIFVNENGCDDGNEHVKAWRIARVSLLEVNAAWHVGVDRLAWRIARVSLSEVIAAWLVGVDRAALYNDMA